MVLTYVEQAHAPVELWSCLLWHLSTKVQYLERVRILITPIGSYPLI